MLYGILYLRVSRDFDECRTDSPGGFIFGAVGQCVSLID